MKTRRLLIQAIQQSELPAKQKLTLRLVTAFNPEVRDAVTDYLEGAAPTLAAAGDGEFIKWIIEHLPEIIAMIEMIIGLFSEDV